LLGCQKALKNFQQRASKPGVVHLVTKGATEQPGLYRFERQMTAGNGKHSVSGFGSNTSAKESVRVGFDYFKGNLCKKRPILVNFQVCSTSLRKQESIKTDIPHLVSIL